MTPTERTAVTIFLLIVVAVFVFALFSIVNILLRKTRIMKGEQSAWSKWLERCSLSVAGIGIVCILYGYFIEPYRLTVREVEIPSEKVASPILIAHFSDVHSDPIARLEPEIPAKLTELKPDLIVYSGDSLNIEEGLPIFRRLMTATAKVAPTFVVMGNWDVANWSNLRLFEETGVTELDAATRSLDIKGNKISVTGIPVLKENSIPDLLKEVSDERLSLFIYHYPDEIYSAQKAGADIYFAGHTHGGQVALPIYGALMTLSKFGKRFEGGTYKVQNTWLNVNRGIGMEGGSAPRVRFWAPPEITLIKVVPKS